LGYNKEKGLSPSKMEGLFLTSDKERNIHKF
jgi:hypothetical protein